MIEGVEVFGVSGVEFDARQALVKLNGKSIQGSLPIADQHRPLLTGVVQRLIEQFKDSIAGWKRAVSFC